jgi:hypothetical protein
MDLAGSDDLSHAVHAAQGAIRSFKGACYRWGKGEDQEALSSLKVGLGSWDRAGRYLDRVTAGY